MAAFEAVSRLQLKPFGKEHHIDVRKERLDSDISESLLDDFDPRDHRDPAQPIKKIKFCDICRIQDLTDIKTARLVYYSYFHSLMSYGLLLWVQPKVAWKRSLLAIRPPLFNKILFDYIGFRQTDRGFWRRGLYFALLIMMYYIMCAASYASFGITSRMLFCFSEWMAYFNLVRTELGAGVLGIPLAISQAGIIFGPILSISTCCLLIHTHVTLLNILNSICKHLKIPHISYRYGFRLALLHGPKILRPIGHCGPALVATFMILSQLGICTVFVIFTTDSLRDMMDWENNKPAILALIIPYLLLEYFMKNLKIVSYISVIGTFFNICGLLLASYHIFMEPRNDTVKIMTNSLPLMFAFGNFLFNQSAIGVILSLDKSLKTPRVMISPHGVINIGLVVPTVIATVFGTLSYWSFGTMEENVLRSLPYDAHTAMASIGLYMIAIAFAYPIQCYPAISIIMEIIRSSDAYDQSNPHDVKLMKSLENISRPLFVLLTFLVCYCIPFQGPFVAFVASICTTMLALVFPALMELSMMYPGPYGKYNIYLIKDLAIILLGLGAFVFGAVLSGYLIYIRSLTMRSVNKEDF